MPPQARLLLRQFHTQPAWQAVRPSPFHQLFLRNATRIRSLHRAGRRWYSDGLQTGHKPASKPAKATTTTTTSAAAAASAASASAPSSGRSLGFSARMRKLSREYGWAAFGIYLGLSALDFPFCFLAVRWLGTDRIGQWEHAVVEWVRRAIPFQWPEKYGGPKKAPVEEGPVDGAIAVYDHGVRQAEAANTGEQASIWTQLALAYAIHKSFIFLRVPLTAAVTPKVVRTLRGWGWNIGKITPKAEREAARAQRQAAKVQSEVQKKAS